ncbi:SDR family oxidoreductase [Sphingobacterium kyonggiense]|jgi:uncharacterized protein YbjT (DUF2867 family)|uniref:SDR family oxidoreductase n=1 Tax=Sphingobacterium kyonggiense TaxID=714075 RepID=A0ABP7Z7Q0_9SPHI|tara:strand:+ start:14165 stop:14812 length:648 start_codon:yes stop_codon:yes gene_type:complete
MNVLLLGATGRLGSEILKRLIDEKIETTALVRNPDKLKLNSEHLTVVKGDVTNSIDLNKAMKSVDVVITALNISRKSDFPWAKLRTPKTLLSDTMKILVDLGEKNDIQKIITISAWGANESKNDLPMWFKWLINNSNVKYGYEDHERQENILVKSDVDWMIIRPVGLSDSQKNKKANISTDSKTFGLLVARKTVANFIVTNLKGNQFVKKIVTIS